MTACTALLAGGPLVCVLPAGHEYGHRFEGASGQAHCPKEEM